ncbi:MAG: hypothetical protein HY537_09785 [Deltaproteobacteria bacterium]|nr:hypothetical protein [Deltaproteobacteria bacterium]
MPFDLAKLSTNLLSSNWANRIAAQNELVWLDTDQQWIEILSLVPQSDYPVLRVLCRHLIHFVVRTNVTAVSKLLVFVFTGQQSPFKNQPDLCREILEGVLKSQKIGYRRKIDICLWFLVPERNCGLSGEARILFIRALAYLKARRAITYFENLIRLHQDEKMIHEIIKALRQIRDRKGGKCLELLFGSSNRFVVASAVIAYGELVGNHWTRAFRLYRLYLRSGENVRLAILSAVARVQPYVASFVLKRLYLRERSETIRYQMLKKLSLVVNDSTARFLMRMSTQESTHRLRALAGWCVDNMPSHSIVRSIRRHLRSANSQLREFAIEKTGQLDPSLALKLLRPLIDNIDRIDRVDRQTLLETLAKNPSLACNEKVERVFLEQLSKEPACALIALIGLLQRENPPINVLIEKLSGAVPQLWMCALSLITEHPTASGSRILIERAKKELCSDISDLRYLSARHFLHQEDPELFDLVWSQALAETESGFNGFSTLISSALSHLKIHPHLLRGKRGPHLLQDILSGLKTGAWQLHQWRDLLLLLDADAANAPIYLNFLHSHELFWTDVFNQLLIEETDADRIRQLGELICSREVRVTDRTLETVFNKIRLGHYRNPESVLAILAQCRPEKMLHNYIDWMVSLPSGPLKQDAFHALAHWIAPRPSLETHRKVAYG